MNYKVLYRKYRPDNFENIIGQNYIIKTLKNSIKYNNISHAYIFSGPRGTGKTSTAKVFSRTINCLDNNDGIPCGKCEFCSNYHENPDIIEIDAASNNGVDEIRNLIDNIKLAPTNGKYKVYIIDEVHMLTTSAFNALLLTLEEPPKHAIFILATTNIENVPITILSRCQRFDFQKIGVEEIKNKLIEISQLEELDVDEDALEEIAYISEGGMRDALSLLDQLSKNKEKITLELVEKQIKIISKKTLKEIINCIEENDIENFIRILKEFQLRGIDYKTLIKRLIEISSNNAKNIKKNGKIKRLTFEQYKKLILTLADCLSKINIYVDPYTILEIELLSFFETKENFSEKKSIEAENIGPHTINNYHKDSSNDIEKLVDTRINNCFVNVQKEFLEEMKKTKEIYENSTVISGKMKSIILDSSVLAASDKYVIMGCDSDRDVEEANKLLNIIEKDIQKLINEDKKFIFITKDRWLKEKEKYIINRKNNKKYQIIEEELNKEENLQINDVFDISKVEII